MKDPSFELIRKKEVLLRLGEDFRGGLAFGDRQHQCSPARLQNHCLDLSWLPLPILPEKRFPAKYKQE